jgi:hypothetical protein
LHNCCAPINSLMHIIISRLSITNQRTYQHQSLMVESLFSQPSLWTFYMLPNVQLQTSSAYLTRYVQSSLSKWSQKLGIFVIYMKPSRSCLTTSRNLPLLDNWEMSVRIISLDNLDARGGVRIIYIRIITNWMR